MANEEKIKAFFGDEKKVKALMNDEKFMNAVSGGQATPETYKDEFKKLGLELSNDEAKIVQKTIAKAMDTPTEKLDDSFLESIAGGEVTGTGVAAGIGLGAAAVVGGTMLSGCGCLFASIIYDAKADRAYNHGDYNAYEKYRAKAGRCLDVGSGLATLGFIPALEKYRNS